MFHLFDVFSMSRFLLSQILYFFARFSVFAVKTRIKQTKRIVHLFGLVMLVGALTACTKKIELQTNIAENDANEVVAALLREGIPAEKIATKTGASVMVADEHIARAMSILTANGLPRKQNMGLGDIFKKEGMISTPLEERARYIFGLSQELERTLSQMDHIVTARVHVVLPERVAPGEPIMPSSAAIFIKHRKEFNADVVLPSIRRLVSTSIPGLSNLDKEKISVIFSQTPEIQTGIEWASFGSLKVASDSLNALQIWFFGLIFTNIVFLALFLVTLFFSDKVRQLLRLDKKSASSVQNRSQQNEVEDEEMYNEDES